MSSLNGKSKRPLQLQSAIAEMQDVLMRHDFSSGQPAPVTINVEQTGQFRAARPTDAPESISPSKDSRPRYRKRTIASVFAAATALTYAIIELVKLLQS